MQTALKQSTIASVTRFPSKLTSDKAFLIFLSNLYYKLECNDQAFCDILTNPRSSVAYPEFNRFGYHTVNSHSIAKILKQFNQDLTHEVTNKLFKQFLVKNNIKKVA